MGRIHAKSCALYVDEHNFSGVSNSVRIRIPNSLSEVTAFADVDATYTEGKAGVSAEVNGLWSTSSPDYDGEMFTDLTAASRRLGIYPGGATKGNFGYELTTKIDRAPRIAPVGGAIALNVTWGADLAALARCVLLDIDTAVAASANGTAYQTQAIGGTKEVYGILRLLTAPGGAGNNTLDVKIQSDDNEAFLTATDRLTFTQLDQASVALFEVQTLAGAGADDWWRVVYTYAGVGTRTFSLVVAVGQRGEAG